MADTCAQQSAAQQLHAAIDTRRAKVAIIGLGYVGLPLSLAFCRAGFHVLGFDVDPHKIELLNRGESYLKHLPREPIVQAIRDARLSATSDFEQLSAADAVLICVPTPLTRHREPEMRYVRETAEVVARHLRPGQLVVLESTTYPGTTDELVLDVLKRSGLSLGKDFFLAYSPEREDPGNPNYDTASIPKLVGGVDTLSGDLAEQLYSAALTKVVRVVNARVAEAAKLTENIFRGVNIALVNELKIAFDRMGIDIWRVLDAAETKPFGFMRFNPGPGWGGHCIPVDPFYMSWKAREFEVQTKFIELAGEINSRMPEYVVHKLQCALNEHRKAVNGSKILILGVAYKADIDDCRESPAFPIMDQLAELGADVCFHDPLVTTLPRTRAWPHLENKASESLDEALLRNVDAVLVVTAHRSVDYELVLQTARLIIDTRGVLKPSPGHVYPA